MRLPKFHYLNVSKFTVMVYDSLTFHNLPGRCGLVNIPFLFAFLCTHIHLKASAIAFAAAYVGGFLCLIIDGRCL